MVSNKQNLNQVSIDKFFRALQSLGVTKDDISGELFNIKYCNVVHYSTHQRHCTPTQYKTEKKDDEKEEVSPLNY